MGISVVSTPSQAGSYTILLDEQPDALYVGKAVPNSVGTAPVWQIRKLETTGTILAVCYADGNDKFDNVWDDRLTLMYC